MIDVALRACVETQKIRFIIRWEFRDMNPEDPPSPPLAFGVNYLIFAADGLYFRSGETGVLRKLTAQEVQDVTPIVEQRRALALQLTQFFRERSFDPGGDGTIDDF